MSKVTIYTSSYCPYCISAKRLLDKKGAEYEEISVDGRGDVRAEMTERSGGGYTVPQIWIGDRHVGGCDDLYALDDAGQLDQLLAA
ncbi:MAG: glutaredoxin 3 [Hyphomicrobiaceae bacterium]